MGRSEDALQADIQLNRITEELNETASRIYKLAGNDMQEIMDKVDLCWRGSSADAFALKLAETQEDIRVLSVRLRKTAEMIKTEGIVRRPLI